jgi:hypothetical protein
VVEKPLHKNKKKEKERVGPNKVSLVKKITCTLKNNKGEGKSSKPNGRSKRPCGLLLF